MRAWFVLPLLLLSACGDNQIDEAERAAAVEEVEAAQTVPAIPIRPETMHRAQIESHALWERGCYLLETDGTGMIALARADDGYLMVDGEIERFAPDKGSAELPHGIYTQYSGTKRSMEFWMERVGLEFGNDGVERFPGGVTVRDPAGRTTFKQNGTVECAA